MIGKLDVQSFFAKWFVPFAQDGPHLRVILVWSLLGSGTVYLVWTYAFMVIGK